jgi:hypothetical protein
MEEDGYVSSLLHLLHRGPPLRTLEPMQDMLNIPIDELPMEARQQFESKYNDALITVAGDVSMKQRRSTIDELLGLLLSLPDKFGGRLYQPHYAVPEVIPNEPLYVLSQPGILANRCHSPPSDTHGCALSQ